MNILNKIDSIKTQKELNEFKLMINEAIEKRANFISLCEFANNASDKSFGYIKESFETISPNLFNMKGGRKILNKYTKTVKENKNLSTLYSLYENVRKVNGDTDIDFFVNNTVNTEWNINKTTLKEDIKKLGNVLAEGILVIGNEAENLISFTENVKLNNALMYIAENKKSNKNISNYSDATKIIRDYVVQNPKVNIFESKNLDEYANNLLEAFNKKYTSDLTEEDWEVLKEIDFSKNKETLFNKYKEDCLNKLSEIKEKFVNEGKNDDSDKISAVIEKINKKSFVVENINTDICGFVEITKIFE